MKIIIAKHAGFCFGVRKAVEAVYNSLEFEKPIYTLGPIIHNPQVVEELGKKGVRIEEDVNRIDQGTVIIRSHGVVPSVYETIRDKKLQLIDATCPYVKLIHEKVKQYYERGYQIIIVGEKNHPEVIGINGWCNNQGIIVYDINDVKQLLPMNISCVVAQTTITQEKWEQILTYIHSHVTDVTAFNTICFTTSERQKEAVEIAQKSDIMLVMGGKNSSNTKKLFSLCQQYCSNTFFVETVQDVPFKQIKPKDTIGITAGASTPDWIIKEVVQKMEEKDQSTNWNEEDDFVTMDDFYKTFKPIHPNQIMKGKIVQVTETEVCVNIGYKSDGIIKKSDLSNDNDINILELYKVGDEIEVEVLQVNDGEGNVILSKKTVDVRKNWEILLEGFENEEIFKGKCLEAVKGGLLANILGIRVFVPASQVAPYYIENLSDYVGNEMRVKIIEMDQQKNKIVVSQKIVLMEEAQKKRDLIWDTLHVGDKMKGIVRKIMDYGVFVDIGGIDGLVHISDLSWSHIKHPSDVIKTGDSIEVIILAMDIEKKRISLGYKQGLPEPWSMIADKYNPGTIVEGKVVRIVEFGAFIELEKGIDGLVHISQIAENHVKRIQDVLKIGDVVKVKILDVKPTERKISLSIKEAIEAIE